MGDISNEPSMEDILSSIKRIIADESETALAGRVRAAPRRAREQPKPQPETEEVLELTEAVDALGRGKQADDSASEPQLVSKNTATASRSALASLSAMVVKPEAAANTLEGMVREMLRPMLKEWLDANLPELVEGMVAREISRISGKAL